MIFSKKNNLKIKKLLKIASQKGKRFLVKNLPVLLPIILICFFGLLFLNQKRFYRVSIPGEYTKDFVFSALGNEFVFRPVSLQLSKRVFAGFGKVKFVEAYRGADVIQEKQENGLKESIILKNPSHPESFSFKIDLTRYDFIKTQDGDFDFYPKGERDNDLKRIFSIPAPFMIDAKGVNSGAENVETTLSDEGILKIKPKKAWLEKAAYPVVLDPTIQLNIINLHSHPSEGDDWVVEFTTIGKDELRIIPDDQATVEDDEFIGLYCDDKLLEPKILGADEIVYANWSCSGISRVIHKTIKAGNHVLRFEFGDQVEYAYNATSLKMLSVFSDTNDESANTGTDWKDVSGISISDTDFDNEGIANGDEILILADVVFEGDNAGTVFAVRMADTGGTGVANTEIQREIRTADARNSWIRILTKTTRPTDTGLVLQKRSLTAGQTAHVHKAAITIISLEDLVSGTDYVYDDDTSTTALPANGSPATFAQITTPASSDWQTDVLVLDSWVTNADAEIDTDSTMHGLQRDSESQVLTTKMESEDLDDYWGGGSMWVFTHTDASAHTYKVQLENSDASTNAFSHLYSSVIAFRSNIFEDFYYDQTATSQDSSTWVEIAGITPFTPTSDGDFLILGSTIFNDPVTTLSDDNRIRIQMDGTNIPSGFDDTTEGSCNEEDTTERYPLTFHSLESLTTSHGNYDFDLDADTDEVNPDFYYASLVALSGQLESVNFAPAISDVSDSPSRVSIGTKIDFSANWSDGNSEGVAMYVCKTDSITPGSGCDAGSWCTNSDDYELGSPISCSYPTTESDLGSNDYYAFVCDDEPSCSSSISGSFVVNERDPANYWSFDKGYGSTITDEITSTYNGTLTNNPTWQNESMCVVDGCLSFNGSDNYVDFGNVGSGLKSLSFWLKTSTLTGSIIDLDGGTHTISVSGGTLSANGFNTPTIYVDGVVSSSITANTWHHVEVTTATTVIASDLDIGRVSTGYFNGFIDEVRIYGYVRNADQIKQDYTDGLTGAGSTAGVSSSFGDASLIGLSSGLAGYWKMDEASGNMVDSSGNSQTLTDTNTVTFVGGRFGNGGDFEQSSSEYQYLADNANLSLTGDLTIGSWIKPESNTASTSYSIVNKWDDSDTAYRLDQYGDELRAYFGSASNYVETSSANLATGQWYHVLVRYDASNAEVKIFVNGQELSTTTSGTIPTSLSDGSGRFHIGANNSSVTAASFYDGVIDEVRVYNRALKLGDIKSLYSWRPAPIAYWNFDEGSGSTVYDLSGNEYNGTITGASRTRGVYGNAMSFDGNNDWVNFGDVDIFDGKSAVSVATWIYFRSTTGDVSIIRKDGSYTSVQIFSGTSLATAIWDPSATEHTATLSSLSISTNRWIHLAVVWDANSNSGSPKVYVDGKFIKSMSNSSTGTVTNSAVDMLLGANESGTEDFNGMLDDVRIYDYALDDQQVVEVMNGNHPVGGSPIASQLGYWKFDEGVGTTAYDSGFGGNDGTLSGSNWTNSGKVGKAVDFGGSGDKVEISGLLGQPSKVTVSAWANLTTPDTNGAEVFSIGDCVSLRLDDDALGLSTAFYDGTDWQQVYTGVDYAGTGWHHFAAVVDPANSDQRLYVDGNLVGSGAFSGAISYAGQGSNTVIGKHGNGNANYDFVGQIDEVKAYNVALSSDEISLDYNQGRVSRFGSFGTDSSGNSSDSFDREFCVPGDGSTCSAPTAYFNFNEKTGTTLYDVTSGSNDGSLTNMDSATDWVRGKFGGALDFDGGDDVVNLSPIISSNANFSIFAWIKTGQTDVADVYAEKDNETSANFDLNINEGGVGNVRCVWRPSSAYSVGGTTNFGINDDTWHQLGCVKNGSSLALYIDGIMVDSRSDLTGTLPVDAGYIGNSPWNRGVTGKIDDIKIYNYARTAPQIAWDYDRGKPVAHWKLNESSGTTAHDESGNGHDGTLTNMDAGTDWVAGNFDNALDFDGTDDYVDVGDLSVNVKSISFWIKADTTTEDIIDLDGGTHTITVSGGVLNAGGFDSPTIYVDGAVSSSLDTNWHQVTIITDTAIDANNLDLGRVSTSYFDGKLDDVRLYVYSLNQVQIKQVYNEGLAVKF